MRCRTVDVFGPAACQRRTTRPTLSIVDEQGTEHVVSAADIEKLPRTKAKVTDSMDQTAEYEGVQLGELLAAQGVMLGKDLRGPRIAS